MRPELYAPDRVRLAVSGQDVQRFLSLAAAQGVRLARVRGDHEGCTLWVAGADLPRLQALAAQGGWQCRVVQRRGPGRRLAQAMRRPGLVCGLALFCALVHLLPGFVWSIDFGTITPEQQPAMRALLADCGVREGVWLTADLLQTAQQRALQCSDAFGWISLNFVEGCLLLESTPTEHRTVQQAAEGALYAKADGLVLAVEAESGFAQVEPGQYAAAGQLLVADTRLDRSGAPVRQAASGRVTARVQRQYTAEQPYEVTAPALTGRRRVRTELTLLGHTWQLADEGTFPQAQTQTEWLTLGLGRAALPGSVQRVTAWEQHDLTQNFSPQTAQALALRACRAQLLAEFPDAVIEAEERTLEEAEGAARATVRYVFRANIAGTAQSTPDSG